MHDPILVKNLAQIRYNEMLQEAEAIRRSKRQKAAGANIRAKLGAYLITAGQKLKAQSPVATESSA